MSALSHDDGDIVSRRRCNECSKAQQPGSERLQVCSRCKWVFYCSRECQTKNWRSHKLFCNQQEGALTEMQTKELSLLRKWLNSHFNFIRALYLNALDVSSNPEVVNTQALVVQLKKLPPQNGVPRHERFDIHHVAVITMNEAVGMLTREGESDGAVEIMKERDLELKRNGRLGIGWFVATIVDTPLQTWMHLRLSDLGDAQRNTIRNFWGRDLTKLARFVLANVVEDYVGGGAERVAPHERDTQALNRTLDNLF